MNPHVFSKLKPVLAIAMLALVAACTTPFEARVQSFQSMPPVQGQSFVVKPVNPSHAGSLEFAAYANLVATELQKQGFRPVASAEGADLEVLVDFGSGPGRERIDTRPGMNSSWGWYGRSWYGRPMWWGGFNDPFWNQPEVYSFTVYPAFVEVDIRRASDQLSLFEGRAETTTRVNDLPVTMPKLVTALFTDFPGASARSKVVRVKP